MEAGRSGRKAKDCSYSYPHSAGRAKWTPSQTASDETAAERFGDGDEEAEGEEEERQGGLSVAEVS
jgi:hypothetical protein